VKREKGRGRRRGGGGIEAGRERRRSKSMRTKSWTMRHRIREKITSMTI
jgi:hypothetical protein